MHDSRNAADSFEITFGGDGKAGFDYVHAKPVELMRQTKLFLMVHAAAGRLFSVAKSGIEYGNARSFRGHVSPLKNSHLNVTDSALCSKTYNSYVVISVISIIRFTNHTC